MMLALFVKGQVQEDFSDGDFTDNPTWTGDQDLFRVNAGELQLFDNRTNDAHLMTSNALIDNARWEFTFRWEGFSPTGLSSSNQVFFYLVANQNVPPETDHIQGYFVRIGNTADEVSLYRQDSDIGSIAELIDGSANGFRDVTVGSSGAIRIRVVRDNSGNWLLEADVNGGTSFSEIGTAMDDTYTTTSFAGIFIDYSSGNADGYFFDDVSITDTSAPDITPPTIESAHAVSVNQVTLRFDEPVARNSSENVSNYTISGGVSVIEAVRDTSNFSQVLLTTTDLTNGANYTVTVNHVTDLAGNEMVANSSIDFRYRALQAAEPNDVVINEFLADPVDNNNDFVELFNRSDKFISMEGWVLADKSSQSPPFTEVVLEPGAYFIVYDEDASRDYPIFGDAIAIPSLTLNNADDEVALIDDLGNEIAFVQYTNPPEEGISYELINPNAACIVESSYAPSASEDGFTPGMQNTVFDDTPDTTPPTISSFGFSSVLTLNFSEPMDGASLISGNYMIKEGLTIDDITSEGAFPESVEISFSEAPTAGVVYELIVRDLMDCAGNILMETTLSFGVGREPGFNELLITEILFDELPSAGLPEREFLELHNPTNDVLSTEGMQLSDATSTVDLPSFNINPGAYVILTSAAGANDFSYATGVSGFPSLNNSGELLILTSPLGLVFSLDYDPAWHDNSRSDGGYSLEMIDTNNPCLESGSNWTSAISVRGGTPGEINSVSNFGSVPDSWPPEVVDVTAIAADTLLFLFNEKIEPASATGIRFSFEPEYPITNSYVNPTQPCYIYVVGQLPLIDDQTYKVSIEEVFDCTGNEIEENETSFALPKQAKIGDVLLSEVLFNPRTNGVDFVELYNTTASYLSLKNWQLARFDADGLDDRVVIADEELVIDPNAFLVLTPSPDILFNNYPKSIRSTFLEVSPFPAYSNDSSTVLLFDDEMMLMERFSYDEDYHYRLLESVDGVSLERVSYEEDTQNPDNWRSASGLVGFATPGYENSQARPAFTQAGRVTPEPNVFIPGDASSGRNFTLINYQLDEPGSFANVTIYDQAGRRIKELANGVSLSTSGFLRWDGETDRGSIARMGYYLILFEIYDGMGNSEVIKSTVVVGRDL